MESTVRFLLVDRQQIYRAGVQLGLHSLVPGVFELIGEAASVQEALGKIRLNAVRKTARLDLVITAYRLSDGTGINLASQISQEFPQIRVLLHSNFLTAPVIISGKTAGVMGFVSKNQPLRILAEAAVVVARGGFYVCTETGANMLRGEFDSLTDREREMLALLSVDFRGQNKDLARLMGVTVNTIKSIRRRLYQKLGVNSYADIMRVAQEYVLPRAPELAAQQLREFLHVDPVGNSDSKLPSVRPREK